MKKVNLLTYNLVEWAKRKYVKKKISTRILLFNSKKFADSQSPAHTFWHTIVAFPYFYFRLILYSVMSVVSHFKKKDLWVIRYVNYVKKVVVNFADSIVLIKNRAIISARSLNSDLADSIQERCNTWLDAWLIYAVF